MGLHVCVCVCVCVCARARARTYTHAAGTYGLEQIFLIQWPLDNCTNDSNCEIKIGLCVTSS